MKKFDLLVSTILKENTNTAGAGGVLGTPESPTVMGDSGWNKGDNRIAQGLGISTRFGRRPLSAKKRKAKKKR